MGFMKLKAVIFDMDGLALDSQRLGTEAWKETVASYGYLLTDEINLRMIGRNKKDTYEILRLAYGPNFPAEEVWDKSYKNFFQKADSTGIPVKDGLREILDFLDANYLPKAIATMSVREIATHHLERVDLMKRFPVMVCGDGVKEG